ncbi:MAG TPA: branched-chain amino acid ABC transporter substrate-binding protein [Gaiellaceae bacterium]|nr:branched-chain amino acid ABC transporter substrate-binding protein [Gaiellaceae bacterium]
MHGSKRKGAAAFAVLTITSLAIVASAFARADVAPTTAAASSAACEDPRIGFMGPITGDAAFIGKEQLGFAKYAIRKLAKGKVALIEGDTQLDPAQASTVGTKFHANLDILAVVGPAGSQEVLAVAPIFKKAQRLPFISGSATRTSLTNGSIPNFFRVVPNDSIQAPTTAKYIRQILKAKDVFIVDDQTAYSKPLANGVQSNLRAAGVKVTRNSVNQKVTDFSALVSKIGADIDVVYLPWQIAANGQIFGQQMKEQGKKAIIFGSDGLDSGDFKLPGSYVSAFAPDIRGIKGNAAFIKGYKAKFVSNFGPPIYVATQAAIAAITKACADGDATRAEVQRLLKRTYIPKTVLGGNLQFTARGDVKGAKFYIFKLGAGGKKTLVG